MNTCSLKLHRPWYQRLLDSIADAIGRLRMRRRAHAERAALHVLNRHLLADVGLEAGLMEAIEAEKRQRAQAVRLHSFGGF